MTLLVKHAPLNTLYASYHGLNEDALLTRKSVAPYFLLELWLHLLQIWTTLTTTCEQA